ncbi:DUF4386 domain-containing protein [Nonomuraea sp. PA05]|uniref:DUF4386 domain-containing protein n=1 Tax=Nonomuraea sp. PA05 TaxID=2604466 RepID=UPI001CA357CD|nr:DUF4386 domain-containing protein [Nonomuraea sp. PA05]
MTSTRRRIAAAAGTFYLITHATSIAALLLYAPILDDPGYIAGSGADTRVLWGAFLEGILALAIVGTAVTLFPIVKKQQEGVALGYVGLRTIESAIITVGIVTLVAIVTLRQEPTETPAVTLITVGRALVAIHNWTFLLGPSFVLGVNTLLMAYLMFRSRLVPRFVAVLGLVGGPLAFASATAVMFGLYEQVSLWGAIAAIPVFGWELSLALWLIVKGFNSAAGTASADH